MALIKYFGQRFGYEGVKFHREGPKVAKTCPGTSLDKATMIKEAKEQNKDVGGKIMALTRGDKGSEVTKLQQNLIALGYGKLMDPYGSIRSRWELWSGYRVGSKGISIRL